MRYDCVIINTFAITPEIIKYNNLIWGFLGLVWKCNSYNIITPHTLKINNTLFTHSRGGGGKAEMSIYLPNHRVYGTV